MRGCSWRVNPWMLVTFVLAGILFTILLSRRPDDATGASGSLERLLQETRKQDGEFPQPMDAINQINDGPIERQAAAMTSASPSSAMNLLAENIILDREPLGPTHAFEQMSPEQQELYDGTTAPRYGPKRKIDDYEDLVFCTIISDLDSTVSLELLRAFVGVSVVSKD